MNVSECMQLARKVAESSRDTTKVGCVIVSDDMSELLATGFNDLPYGVSDAVERRARPAKYKWTEHAERNAIYSAARLGVSLRGAVMVLPWFPCTDCARAIIQSGIRRLIANQPDLNDPRWGEDFGIALTMFAESGVTVEYVE
jgi:dCMP deaminase